MQVWSGPDGRIGAPDADAVGVQGVYRGDIRLLSRVLVSIDGAAPEPIGHTPGSDHGVFTAALRTPLAATPDPYLVLEIDRRLSDDALTETLIFRSALEEPVGLEVEVEVASDLADMSRIKSGLTGPLVSPEGDERPVWRDGGTAATLRADPADLADVRRDGPLVRLGWTITVPAGGSTRVSWRLETVDADATLVAPSRRPIAARLGHGPTDPRWGRWLSRSAADLDALLLAPRDRPERAFLAAGAPWYFTLFGRDSLWAARMLLPVCPELALTTVQILADRQGVRSDSETAEQPGKILHELRDRPVRLTDSRQGAGLVLPPVYYGSTDATCLWISLLAEIRRAAARGDAVTIAAVEALLPALEAALGWLRDDADADGDGFVEYRDESGQGETRGLANQGWKDSADSIRFADGSLAQGSIALVEVQGYAHRAALDGAELLDALGRPGGEEWRQWAAELAVRFRSAFWCSDERGRYPALALDDPQLDGHKRRVDGVSSNIGHLLGTGILDAAESAEVAARLADPTMSSGYGVRTLSSDNGGYWPWSYHCGSVWAHDTAVIIDGLRRDGHREQAVELATGLLAAAEAFDGRLPELYAGDGVAPDRPPSPYPASCRPQAWAAAAVVPAAQALGII